MTYPLFVMFEPTVLLSSQQVIPLQETWPCGESSTAGRSIRMAPLPQMGESGDAALVLAKTIQNL